MNTIPEKCPKCGACVESTWDFDAHGTCSAAQFRCESIFKRSAEQTEHTQRREGAICAARQRDQLVNRVAILEKRVEALTSEGDWLHISIDAKLHGQPSNITAAMDAWAKVRQEQS